MYEVANDPAVLANRLRKHVVAAARLCSLADYAFYVFSGDPVEIVIDEDTLSAGLKLGDKLITGRISADNAVSLVGGRIASIPREVGQASSWEGADEFDF